MIDDAKPDGWLWKPSETSNKWNFTANPMRRPYPKDALFVPCTSMRRRCNGATFTIY